VRKIVIVGCCSALLLLSACGSSAKTDVSPTSSVPAGGSTTTSTVEFPTTSLPCQAIPIPTTPVTSPVAAKESLLAHVEDLSDSCVDHVIFDFVPNGTDPPGYTITYGTPPFAADGSGETVPVAGTAFIVVKVQPGYGYDFATGKATYTGPKSIPVANTNHVKAVVETGDFEGVLTWVIGLDTKRPFSVEATATPKHQLVVTVS
jgi:hypothetical protein